jgi:hypothetical protein
MNKSNTHGQERRSHVSPWFWISCFLSNRTTCDNRKRTECVCFHQRRKVFAVIALTISSAAVVRRRESNSVKQGITGFPNAGCSRSDCEFGNHLKILSLSLLFSPFYPVHHLICCFWWRWTEQTHTQNTSRMHTHICLFFRISRQPEEDSSAAAERKERLMLKRLERSVDEIRSSTSTTRRKKGNVFAWKSGNRVENHISISAWFLLPLPFRVPFFSECRHKILRGREWNGKSFTSLTNRLNSLSLSRFSGAPFLHAITLQMVCFACSQIWLEALGIFWQSIFGD